MNNLLKILTISTLFLTSCEKVIELDLNDSDPQVIIEGNISDDATEQAEVRLSKSLNFDEDNNFPPLSNAVVIIKNQTSGIADTLKEVGKTGVYRGSKLVATVGNTYNLTVVAEGKTYTASSTVPRKVNLDSIRFVKQALFGNERIQTIPVFKDPAGIGDNYRFIMSVNGKKTNDIFIINDELSDGVLNGRPLGGGPDGENPLTIGDTMHIQMLCIDKPVYFYFETLTGGGGGPGGASATPTNPTSNIVGGALGYFSAFTKQSKTTIVK